MASGGLGSPKKTLASIKSVASMAAEAPAPEPDMPFTGKVRIPAVITRLMTNVYIAQAKEVLEREDVQEDLRMHNITHVLLLAPQIVHPFPRVIQLSISTEDQAGFDLLSHMERTSAFIDRGRKLGGVLLVDRAGGAEAATMFMAFLLRLGLSKFDANQFLNRRLKSARPNYGFDAQLDTFATYPNCCQQNLTITDFADLFPEVLERTQGWQPSAIEHTLRQFSMGKLKRLRDTWRQREEQKKKEDALTAEERRQREAQENVALFGNALGLDANGDPVDAGDQLPWAQRVQRSTATGNEITDIAGDVWLEYEDPILDRLYYYCAANEQGTWEAPTPAAPPPRRASITMQPHIAAGWSQMFDMETLNIYYLNTVTGETAWHLPEEAANNAESAGPAAAGTADGQEIDPNIDGKPPTDAEAAKTDAEGEDDEDDDEEDDDEEKKAEPAEATAKAAAAKKVKLSAEAARRKRLRERKAAREAREANTATARLTRTLTESKAALSQKVADSKTAATQQLEEAKKRREEAAARKAAERGKKRRKPPNVFLYSEAEFRENMSQSRVSNVHFALDGSHVMCSDIEGNCKMLIWRSGSMVARMTSSQVENTHRSWCLDCQFTIGGQKLVATVSFNGDAKIWQNPRTGKVQKQGALPTLVQHMTGKMNFDSSTQQHPLVSRCGSIAFAPDATEVVTTSESGITRLYQLPSARADLSQVKIPMLAHKAGYGLMATYKGLHIAWDEVGNGLAVPISRILFTTNGKYIVTGGLDGIVHLWDRQFRHVRSLPASGAFKPCDHAVMPKKMNLEGELVDRVAKKAPTLPTPKKPKKTGFEDTPNDEAKSESKQRNQADAPEWPGPILDVACNMESTLLATASANGLLTLWDIETGEVNMKMQTTKEVDEEGATKAKQAKKRYAAGGVEGAATRLKSMVAAKYAAATHNDAEQTKTDDDEANKPKKVVKVLPVDAQGIAGVLPNWPGCTCVRFSWNGEFLAYGTESAMVHIWDLVSRMPVCESELESEVSAIAWSLDDTMIAAATSTGRVTMFELRRRITAGNAAASAASSRACTML